MSGCYGPDSIYFEGASGFVKSNNVWMLRPPSRKICEKKLRITAVFPGRLLSADLDFQRLCIALSGYFGPQVKKNCLMVPYAAGELPPELAIDNKRRKRINGSAPYCLEVTALPTGKFLGCKAREVVVPQGVSGILAW